LAFCSIGTEDAALLLGTRTAEIGRWVLEVSIWAGDASCFIQAVSASLHHFGALLTVFGRPVKNVRWLALFALNSTSINFTFPTPGH
jgi:hypothetical protein